MKVIILSCFAALMVFSSCSPTYYPPKINAPLLREEGQTKINAAMNLNSINIQASTAITENFAIAVSANGYLLGAAEITTSNGSIIDEPANGFQFDIMPGYYVPFGEEGVVEIYAGYGAGMSNSGEVSGLLHRFILQPSIGRSGEKFEFAFACRFSHVMIPEVASLSDPKVGFSDTFLEPGLILRLGSEKVKFTSQIGLSLPIVNIPEDPNGNYIEWNPFIINFGLQFFIEEWKFKESSYR